MADTKVETSLFKKIVPARGAAQRAAQTLKEQTRKRPRRSRAKNVQLSLPAGELETSALADDNDGDNKIFRGVSSKELRGRGSIRGRCTEGRDSAFVRRRSGNQSSKISPHSSVAPSRHAGPTLPAPLESPQKRPKFTLSHCHPQSSGTTSLSTNMFLTAQPYRSSTKYPNIYIENDVIWIRLDSWGTLMDPNAEGRQPISYWWPAQVTSDDPLKVSARLFGDDGHGDRRLVEIVSPSSSTVRPFRDRDHVRFSPATFIFANKGLETNELDVPTNFVLRWTHARDQALRADMDDELPDASSLISHIHTGKGSQRERNIGHSLVARTQTLTPTPTPKGPIAPLDEEIKVGEEDGELVLARDHKDRADHWPARVVGVIQDRKNGKWLYEVKFIDGKKKKLERDRFFSSDQEGFATCQLGIWRTEYPMSDSEAPDSEDEMRASHDTRSPSPSPSNPDLEDIIDIDAFRARPLAEQLRYVYPFLCRVIRREYGPSYERHDCFMKGGKPRDQLSQTASIRGNFSFNEVKKISLLVRRTMLKDERWAERVHDTDETQIHVHDTTPRIFSDGTKTESHAGTISVRSSDLDAALALTELKSSDLSTPDKPSSSALSGFVAARNSDVNRQMSISSHVCSRHQVSDMEADLHLVPSSSLTLERCSDVEFDIDDEDAPLLPRSPRTFRPSHQISPAIQKFEVPIEPPVTPTTGPSIQDISAASACWMRPKGCDAYESLSRSERCLYCADVLLPETVLQLHLLRDGRRTSARLLTQEAEKSLYAQGQELLRAEEVHWVTQILQMRNLAENSYKKRTKEKDKVPWEIIGGTSTRPRARKAS